MDLQRSVMKGTNETGDAFHILAGWFIDGTGERIKQDLLIQVVKGVITSMKRSRPQELESIQGKVLDFSDCTVLPGLVDCHVHLTMSGTNDLEIRKMQLALTFAQAERIIAERIRRQLNHGIIALRDGGDSAGHTFRYQDQCLAANKLPVYLRTAGKAWRSRGRYGRLIGRPPADGCSLAQCIERQEKKADHVKIINSGLNSLTEFGKQTAPQFDLETLEAAVQAARLRRQKVMVHANGRVPVRLAVDAGCDSIEHGFFMGRENLERIAELQTFWVPTAFSMRAFSRQLPAASIEAEVSKRNLDHQLQQIALARQAGVPIAVGTDCGSLGIHHGKAFIEEFKLLMEAGFSTADAIRCATLEGARLLGLENQLGQLKKGMPATFIAVAGDPSSLPDALLSPQQVYVCGRLIA